MLTPANGPDENQIPTPWITSSRSTDAAKSAKKLTKQYYGRVATRTYWNGCSTGGRQGMEMAQYHPDMFDRNPRWSARVQLEPVPDR